MRLQQLTLFADPPAPGAVAEREGVGITMVDLQAYRAFLDAKVPEYRTSMYLREWVNGLRCENHRCPYNARGCEQSCAANDEYRTSVCQDYEPEYPLPTLEVAS